MHAPSQTSTRVQQESLFLSLRTIALIRNKCTRLRASRFPCFAYTHPSRTTRTACAATKGILVSSTGFLEVGRSTPIADSIVSQFRDRERPSDCVYKQTIADLAAPATASAMSTRHGSLPRPQSPYAGVPTPTVVSTAQRSRVVHEK